jgi:hypothetical protein
VSYSARLEGRDREERAPARVVSSGTSPLTGPAEESDWGLLGQWDFIGVAIGVVCLLIAYGVLTILGAHRSRGARHQPPPAAARAMTVARTPEAASGPPGEAARETPEPRELIRQWLDESQRMLEATRRERAEMAEAFDGVATRLLQLEQAAGALAQGLRAKR